MVLEGEEQIEFFVLLSFRGRLQLEVNSGLEFRTPTLKTYNAKYGTTFTRKAQALEDAERRVSEAQEARGEG